LSSWILSQKGVLFECGTSGGTVWFVTTTTITLADGALPSEFTSECMQDIYSVSKRIMRAHERSGSSQESQQSRSSSALKLKDLAAARDSATLVRLLR
jgi:hypothetical protein